MSLPEKINVSVYKKSLEKYKDSAYYKDIINIEGIYDKKSDYINSFDKFIKCKKKS
jgi:hypothetical protein